MTGEGDTASARKVALYSGIAALFAFIACNGLIVVTAVLALFGVTFSMNPHLLAILISIFAILTTVLVFKGYLRHHKFGPLFLAGAGALVIIFTMYISYSKLAESAGLLVLITAAGWNWWVARRESESS